MGSEIEEDLWDTNGIIKCVTRTNLEAQDALKNQTHVPFQQLFEDWVITLFASSKDGVSSENRYKIIRIPAPSSPVLRVGEIWTEKQLKGWGILYIACLQYNGDERRTITIDVLDSKKYSVIYLRR